MEHHELSPSKFPAWLQCACFDACGEVGEPAERGTLMHDCFAALLKTGEILPAMQGLNDNEYTGLMWAANYVRIAVQGCAEPYQVETKLEYFEDDDFEPLFYGTPDVANSEGHLFDLKTGEEREYWPQLAGY